MSARQSLSEVVRWTYSVGDVGARRCPLTVTYLSLMLDREKILLERSEEGGKTKSRFKTAYDKTSTQCLNKKS